MKRTWFSLLAVLVFALTLAVPALAAVTNWELNVHNNTEGNVKINLNGPKDYVFTVGPGKFTKTVQEGTYDYTYKACGEEFTGAITVEDDLQWLVIEKCPPPDEFAKFVVYSHLGEALTVQLVGPQSYDLSVSLGTNRFPALQTGFYTYTYTACDGTQAGQIRIEKNGTSQLTLYSCEFVSLHPSLVLAQAPSNLRIGSHYGFPVRISLFGPINYSFVVDLGLNRFNVWPGSYAYSYTAFGRTVSGSFTVPADGVSSFIISPLH